MFADGFLAELAGKFGKPRSVGVGGVLTINGVSFSPEGGVCGGLDVLRALWPSEERRARPGDVNFGESTSV